MKQGKQGGLAGGIGRRYKKTVANGDRRDFKNLLTIYTNTKGNFENLKKRKDKF
ncbi:MAG: hypothetical protein SOW56_04995 [Bacteroidaceae bacterium]|nr:hypothetical protein [Bacteroidaceae bacterium]